MPNSMKIYHNPKCTKSRQTLALLREHGVEPVVVEYLKTPPSEKELDAILTALGMRPFELARKKESRDAGLDLQSMTRRAAIAAMSKHPQIIQRPIVISGRRAAVGRPPEDVLSLLGGKE